MSRRATAVLLLVLTAATGLTGCSGDDDAADQKAADCIDATEYGPTIAKGAKGAKGSKITPGGAQAVQSAASDLYYVAMDFTIDGDDETGVWITSTLDPAESGSILAVDNLAKTVTQWPDAEKAFDITYPNENSDAAEACLD